MTHASGLARKRPRLAGSRAVAAAAGVGAAAFTALVVFVRQVDVAYRSPAMHVALETLAAAVGTVAAYLLLGRHRLSMRLADLLLALSLLVLAIGSLFFSVLPAVLSGDNITQFSTWAPIMSGLLGAVGFAIAAFSRHELRLRRRTTLLVGFGFVGIMVLIAIATDVLAARLPVAIPPALSPVQGGRELVIGNPAVLALQLVTVVLFAVSSVGFLRRGEQEDDELMRTLSLATILGAFAAFNYFLFPSLYSQWVYSGDILRFAFYLVIFAAVARELNSYWRGLAHAAALEERRRIARELHDGLAQELAFISSQSRLLAPGPLERQLASAADRALAESRRAIDALTRPLDEPLETSLRRAAEEIATRFGTDLTLRMQEGISAAPALGDTLRRITREAMINAAQHGQAPHIVITLERSAGRIRLVVEDDGVGFDPTHPSSGFGLISMRERASSHRGELFVRSQSGVGTRVEVLLP